MWTSLRARSLAGCWRQFQSNSSRRVSISFRRSGMCGALRLNELTQNTGISAQRCGCIRGVGYLPSGCSLFCLLSGSNTTHSHGSPRRTVG
jgi:hypothetical protein